MGFDLHNFGGFKKFQLDYQSFYMKEKLYINKKLITNKEKQDKAFVW